MDNYRLYNVVRHILSFLEQLTNWYVRLNRSRMKGEAGVEDQFISLNTLFDVLLNSTIMMSCITPFLAEHIYQNLRNGISKENTSYHAESIHFLQIPEYQEKLLNERIEQMVQRMQSAIEIGRKIRDTKNLSLKTPLSKCIIVQSEKTAIEDLKTLESYIKDELNCLDFEIIEDEQEYVIYNTAPDHKEIGGALKKLYTKELKEKLGQLTREEVISYLKNGKINVNGVDIQEGWLQISKQFNDRYQHHTDYAVSSSLDTSVMLVTALDDNLRSMGIAREIVNKVQKLRKATGLLIDDKVEIFFERHAEGHHSDTLKTVLEQHVKGIRQALKVPFLEYKFHQGHFVKLAETEYANPENEKEIIKIYICVPAVTFNEERLIEKYGQFNSGKANFVNDIMSFLISHDREALKRKVESNQGKLKFKLNDQEVELVYKIPSANTTQRQPNTQNYHSVSQARARSVNAHNSKGRRHVSNNSYSQPTSTSNNNARAVSLSNKFVFANNENNNIDKSHLMQTVPCPDPLSNLVSANNTTTHQQLQLQQFLASHNNINNNNNNISMMQSSSIDMNSQLPLSIQTPTHLQNSGTNQYSKRYQHSKNYSMNQNIKGSHQPLLMMNSQTRISNKNNGGSEQQHQYQQQHSNLPLSQNQQLMNQTLQFGGSNMIPYGPSNYATIGVDPSYYHQYQQQQKQLQQSHNSAINNNTLPMTNNHYMKGYSPQNLNPISIIHHEPSQTSTHYNQSYIYNPFQNYKQATSSSRLSNSKMNNTIQHVRSFSNCSKRDILLQSKKAIGMASNTSQTIQAVRLNQISETQLLESEEYFEQGKHFLSDKKYKEAIKAFSKSLQLNKMNFDALFYKGVTQLDQGQPQKAIEDLNQLIEICPEYRKTMFIVLSIAYRRVNDYTGALRTLSKAVFKYNRYLEAYIARGQIYIFQKKWDKALSDFRIVIQLQPENGLGYLGQGDSLKGIGNYNGALLSYSKAIEIDQQCLSQGLMKRGILYLQMKYSEQALEDFNKLTEIAEQSDEQASGQTSQISKAYFYKAKAMKKMNNYNDAILHFEQVIKLSDDNFLQSSSLYEIAKIRIQQKDFYEAHYNLKRATHFKLKQKKLINYKIFTEGVIFLMKRKTKTGIKLLSTLLDKLQASSQQTQTDYITPLIYIYRAYGYFVNDEFDKSLKDYIKSNQMKKLNMSATYNMIMCQGLKSLEKKEYENAISFFTKASQKLPGLRDPYFLRAVSIVRYALHKPIKPQTKNKMLRDAKRDLNRALKHSPKDYQVMYFRGILNFALHYFYDAITDFETVIEKSEETSAKFYLARGRCYACLSLFKESITDLSIAINLNKDLLDAYLNRGKCAYLIGDTGLAFMDFQKLIVLEPKNPMVHIYAGNLLMTTGSYEDATKAFSNADNIHKSPLALYQRSRCHVALNNMTDALKDLNKVIEISPNDKVALADKDCLNALKIGSANNLANPVAHDKQMYEKAVIQLTKLISYEKNEHLAKINHDSSIMHQHSQIIPSAQRTKTDKIRAIRRRKEQDKQLKQGGSGGDSLRRNDLRYRVAQQNGEDEDDGDEYEDYSEIDEQEMEKLNRRQKLAEEGLESQMGDDEEYNEEETNYYKENIFNKEDFYLYRAVMYFYSGEYDKAIQDFDQSSSIMHSNKVLYPKNQFPDKDLDDDDLSPSRFITHQRQSNEDNDDDNGSQGSSQTDLSDVGLCSLNIHEYSFNIVLCLLQNKDYKKAVTKLDYMLDTVPKKYSNQLWIMRGICNQVLGHSHLAKKDLKRALKYDKDNTIKFIDQKQSITLSVFPQQSRLCNSYAPIKFQFPGYTSCIFMKPSFSFPFIKPPNMIPCVDNSVLEQFTIKAIPLKPEAPWIKKCSFGIKFTEEIYFTDDDREATPDEDKEYKKRKQQQQQQARTAVFQKSFSEKVILRNKIFMKEEDEPQKPVNMHEDDEQYYEEDEFENMDQIKGQEEEEEGGYEDDDMDEESQDNVKKLQNNQKENVKQYSEIKKKQDDSAMIEASFLAEINKKMK